MPPLSSKPVRTGTARRPDSERAVGAPRGSSCPAVPRGNRPLPRRPHCGCACRSDSVAAVWLNWPSHSAPLRAAPGRGRTAGAGTAGQ